MCTKFESPPIVIGQWQGCAKFMRFWKKVNKTGTGPDGLQPRRPHHVLGADPRAFLFELGSRVVYQGNTSG